MGTIGYKLLRASERGYTAKVKKLLTEGAPVNIQDKERANNTPLHLAAQYGRTDTVVLLIEHKADINIKNKWSITPLMKSACAYKHTQGHMDVIRLLVEALCDINYRGYACKTAAELAAERGNRKAIEYLLNEAPRVQERLRKEKQSLASKAELEAKRRKDKEELKRTLLLGRELNKIGIEGKTAKAKSLLDKGAPVDWQDGWGNSALHWASANGHTDLVMLFIEHKANIDMRNMDSETPLIFAARANRMVTVRALVDAGANIRARSNINQQSFNAAEWAKTKGHDAIAESLANEEPDVQKRLRKKKEEKQRIAQEQEEKRRKAEEELRMKKQKEKELASKRLVHVNRNELERYLRNRVVELKLDEYPEIIDAIVKAGYDGETLIDATKDELLDICANRHPILRKLLKVIKILKAENQADTQTAAEESKGGGKRWIFSESDITLGDKIGQGNFGTVYQVKVKGVDTKCALKVPSTADASSLTRTEFENSVKIGTHHNLLRFVGVATYKGTECFITELCELGSLDKLHNTTDLTLKFFQIAGSLCSAVCHLHARSPPVIHRDISCRNVLVRANWTLVLADYGLACQANSQGRYYVPSSRNTALPMRWMPPEILVDRDKDFSRETDIWQIGVTMWEVLTKGQKPYNDWKGDEALLYSRIGTGSVKLLMPSGCKDELSSFVNLCCTFEKKARPSAIQLLCDHIPGGAEIMEKSESELVIHAAEKFYESKSQIAKQ